MAGAAGRRRAIRLLTVFHGLVTLAAAITLLGIAAAQSTRDRVFWVSIIQNKYEVPAGEDPFTLLVEMNTLVGSIDPVLRDDVVYGSALRWVGRRRLLSAEQQKALLTMWSDNLSVRLGEQGTDNVFRRSFSALNLSLLAAVDNEASFLTPPEHDAFVAKAVDYLTREKDTRGYDATKGWMHTPAHTADLLKFLARSAKLAPARQGEIIRAIAAKNAAVGQVFVWGEDERLAQVVRSIVRRADFDPAAVDAWIADVVAAHKGLWAQAPAIDPAKFVPVENNKRVMRAVFVALSADQDLLAPALAARERLLGALSKL